MTTKKISQLLKKQYPKNQENHALHLQRHQHQLPIDTQNVAQVIQKLWQKGYEAYLVGGAVRDYLLGVSPKDFDVATNATPEQVRQVFKSNSRVIGKRFPIVHVIMGGETIEVSTFRSGQSTQNQNGRVVRDNHYGTIEQDVVRRDFTCNALYYDMKNHQILDFHNGVEHIKQKRLVMIGDPKARYLEDPVRILRAIRLSSKLGFVIDDETVLPIANHVNLLKNEPVSRLFDEILKMVFSGNSVACLKTVQDLHIKGSDVHPLLALLQQAEHNQMVQKALVATDERIGNGQSVSAGFLLAVLLWHKVNEKWQKYQKHGENAVHAMTLATQEFRAQTERSWGIQQKMSVAMFEIWELQPKFAFNSGKRALKLLTNPRFRAAYDFYLLREQVGEVDKEMAEWWTVFQKVNFASRNEMISAKNIQNQDDKLNQVHENVPPEWHNFMQMILSGDAICCLNNINDDNMPFAALLRDYQRKPIIEQLLLECDKRVQSDKNISLAWIVSALLWSEINEKWQQYQEYGKNSYRAMTEAINEVRDELAQKWQIPPHILLILFEIWQLQPDFELMSGKRPLTLGHKACFHEAYDLYALRGQSGEMDLESVQWWAEFQQANPKERQKMAYGSAPIAHENANDDNDNERVRKPNHRKRKKRHQKRK